MLDDLMNIRSKKIAINSLISSFSLILAIISRYLFIPFLPVLKIDLSDFPIFLSTFLFGFSSGSVILFVVSLIKCLFFSSTGWMGFIMKMISILSIAFIEIYHRKRENLLLLMICAIIFPIFVKIPINYVLWTKFYFKSADTFINFILPIVIPYNLTKNLVNLLLAYLFYKKMKNFKV